jgi:hypothetical protein
MERHNYHPKPFIISFVSDSIILRHIPPSIQASNRNKGNSLYPQDARAFSLSFILDYISKTSCLTHTKNIIMGSDIESIFPEQSISQVEAQQEEDQQTSSLLSRSGPPLGPLKTIDQYIIVTNDEDCLKAIKPYTKKVATHTSRFATNKQVILLTCLVMGTKNTQH